MRLFPTDGHRHHRRIVFFSFLLAGDLSSSSSPIKDFPPLTRAQLGAQSQQENTISYSEKKIKAEREGKMKDRRRASETETETEQSRLVTN